MNNVSDMENGAPAAPGQTNTVFVYVQNAKKDPKEHFSANYSSKLIKGLAGAQISMAIVAVLTQIIVIGFDYYMAEVGAGIWAGVPFAIAGAFGLYSAHKPTNCTVITFMVLNIFAALFAIFLAVFSGIGMGTGYYRRSTSSTKVLYAFQLLAALVEGVLAVAAAAICCRVTCCRTSKSSAGQVFYQGQQLPVPMGQIDMNGFPGLAARPQTETANAAEKERMSPSPPNYDETVGSTSALDEAAESVPADGESYQRFS